MPSTSRARGFTLLELMVTMAVLAIVAAAVLEAVVTAHRTQRSREMLTRVQGESRDALRGMEQDLRAASLGATSGVIWGDSSPPALAVDPNPVLRRPAVQIFDNVPGGSEFLRVKPGTDAVLVVAALRGTNAELPEALVSERTHYDATQAVTISEVGHLAAAPTLPYVLVGAADATWAKVSQITGTGGAGSIVLDVANGGVFPGGKADAGSRVRLASAHLYWVDEEERLLRGSLTAPRPPLQAAEVFDIAQLAAGIENFQVDCETEGGLGVLGPCPGVIPANPLHRLVEEAKPAGLAAEGSGPRFSDTSISSLRLVHLMVVARSLAPVIDGRGDDPIAVGNQDALLPVDHPELRYNRRLYRMTIGVRNTSLGAL